MTSDFLEKVLGARQYSKRVHAERFDEENFDALMVGTDEEVGRPWETFELTQAENVLEWVEDPDGISHIVPNLEDLVREILPLRANTSLLDVGCYGGYLYDFIASRSKGSSVMPNYTGIDINPDVVRAAAEVHKLPNTRFEVGDVFALEKQFGAASFDYVVCSRVLIHLPYMEDALRNLFAVAKSKALVILEVGDRSSLQMIDRMDSEGQVIASYYYRRVALSAVKKICRGLTDDFRIVACQGPYSLLVLNK